MVAVPTGTLMLKVVSEFAKRRVQKASMVCHPTRILHSFRISKQNLRYIWSVISETVAQADAIPLRGVFNSDLNYVIDATQRPSVKELPDRLRAVHESNYSS